MTWLDPGITWTDGQSVSVSLEVYDTLPDNVEREYGWCYNRLSEEACNANIVRWAGEPSSVAPLSSGHCPRTHSTRTATTGGIRCYQSYPPVLTEDRNPFPILPASDPDEDDTWDGTPRGCQRYNSWGYYNFPGSRLHGLEKGCHQHGTDGLHEHTRRTH